MSDVVNHPTSCGVWPKESQIFVFGSNLRGAHGAGAALFAKLNHGAQLGVGEGRTGQAYALPTKDYNIRTLPLEHISRYVDRFLLYASGHPDLHFRVTRVGCGLAGYKDADIAPMFKGAPTNCSLPDGWR